jgi:hypothetical protein
MSAQVVSSPATPCASITLITLQSCLWFPVLHRLITLRSIVVPVAQHRPDHPFSPVFLVAPASYESPFSPVVVPVTQHRPDHPSVCSSLVAQHLLWPCFSLDPASPERSHYPSIAFICCGNSNGSDTDSMW